MLNKVRVTVLFFGLFTSHVLWGQTEFEPLSVAEKVADFNYLYQELEQSYPYFDINKRVYHIDWLSNKKQYLEQIRKTSNDKAFFEVFSGILNDLNNDHTDAYPTIIYPYFYHGCKQAASQYPVFKNYVTELGKTDSIRSNYWKEINAELFFPKMIKEELNIDETNTQEAKNVEFSFVDSISTAVVHIKSFGYEFIEEDADVLKDFFGNLHSSQNLIIDIQGNDGGSTEYWMQNIVPHLINKTICYPLVYGFKNSNRLRRFKPDYFEDTIAYKDIRLPNMPKELKNGSYLFRRESISIEPAANRKKYKGNIYLLVDGGVFSSSEALAYFFKSTNFGIVAGEKTNGDGVGTDPLLLTLPNSGIVVRFTGEMGLNPDGSANDETKTVPDLRIEASGKKERRQKLLEYIRDKK